MPQSPTMALSASPMVANVMPGDDMFMKYLDSSTDTGHVVTIMAAPTLVSTNATQRVYKPQRPRLHRKPAQQ